jgi:hypothetical protein
MLFHRPPSVCWKYSNAQGAAQARVREPTRPSVGQGLAEGGRGGVPWEAGRGDRGLLAAMRADGASAQAADCAQTQQTVTRWVAGGWESAARAAPHARVLQFPDASPAGKLRRRQRATLPRPLPGGLCSSQLP